MSLIVAFDYLEEGNNFILDYLINEFQAIILDQSKDLKDQLTEHSCLFTTSLDIAKYSHPLIKTIVYLKTKDFNCNFLNKIEVLVNIADLSTFIFNKYRVPCTIQHPYVPLNRPTTGKYIVYQGNIPLKLRDYNPIKFTGDFSEAQLYIHIPEPDEQWNINTLIASSYGVPTITYNQGYFNEFISSGDKLVSKGMDWINTFRIALRDWAINSKTVYKMGQRFNVMNELNEKIKQVMRQNNVRGSKQPSFMEVQKIANNADAIKKLQNRPALKDNTVVQKIVRTRPVYHNNYGIVHSFLNTHSNIYAGVGGIGDAFLTLALAYNDPDANIIFSANGGVSSTIGKIFETFNIETCLINNFNGSPEGIATWNAILDHTNFKSAGHIPRNLNYGDWNTNAEDYFKKMITYMPLIEILGKIVNPRNTKKVIGLAPSGSDHTSTWKQRYLSVDEFKQLVKKLLVDSTVIVFGSEEDLGRYGVYEDNNVIFMNSNFAVSYPAPRYPISMRHMLTALNACSEIISVDTWVKTYAALAKIPCKVIMNRYFGKSTTEYFDPSDKIFLNTKFWDFQIVPFEELI